MDRSNILKLAIALLMLGSLYSLAANPEPSQPRPAEECTHLALGTTQPNTSGSPKIINPETGTVISANFFNSGAIIFSPFFDGNEFVSVCVVDPELNDSVVAEISTEVSLIDNTLIKAYPEFIFGTKFGNQFETSFRFYNNADLPPEQQWPVTATNLANNGQAFTFANLEYVSEIKGIGLPAFTNALPQIDIILNLSEENVVGAERDVMLESWFFDTSANGALIGNNTVTDKPIASTLNNIVGNGHPHFDQLNNTLLEMMVHLGPLSPNDISNATRNPGQFQLTENYSGSDHDGDGIDDHFDVDSHINVNNSLEPRPGIYSSGLDANGDGIDDADILPVTIGDFQYSIWYGTNGISPLVIYSRETNSSLTNDFDPLVADMNFSEEGEITLDWNLFLDYTINDVQTQLQTADIPWANGPDNLFDKIRASGGAIGGLEIGVEPQINNPTDEAYILRFSTLDITVDGVQLGLTPEPTPKVSNTGTCNGLTPNVFIANGDVPSSSADIILGTAGADTINGLGGNDIICGLDGNDIINAGGGNDWVDGGAGADDIIGGGGNDELYGGSGDDIIVGGAGNDDIEGNAGDDMLFGQSGEDTIDGGSGVDDINGGAGRDLLFTGAGATVGTGFSVNGGGAADIIHGGADADFIRGGGGADTIRGGDGDDVITGGVGRDEIYGEAGADDIRGQDSVDTLDGGSGADVISGGAQDDVINGGSGDDMITGGSGDDVINGDAGSDTLLGGSDDDELSGGPSSGDTCDGQSGTDTASGSCEIVAGVP